MPVSERQVDTWEGKVMGPNVSLLTFRLLPRQVEDPAAPCMLPQIGEQKVLEDSAVLRE